MHMGTIYLPQCLLLKWVVVNYSGVITCCRPLYIYIYIYMHVSIYIYISVFIYMHIHICIHMFTNVYLCSKHSCHIYKYMHAYICVCAYIYFYMYKDISMFKTFMCTQCVHIEGCAHVRPAHRSMTHP